jgi:hypothetical protein
MGRVGSAALGLPAPPTSIEESVGKIVEFVSSCSLGFPPLSLCSFTFPLFREDTRRSMNGGSSFRTRDLRRGDAACRRNRSARGRERANGRTESDLLTGFPLFKHIDRQCDTREVLGHAVRCHS